MVCLDHLQWARRGVLPGTRMTDADQRTLVPASSTRALVNQLQVQLDRPPARCRPSAPTTNKLANARLNVLASKLRASSSQRRDALGEASVTRRLLAVVYFDLVGYGSMIGQDDQGTVRRLRALRTELINPHISRHDGRLIQTAGDSYLVVFESVTAAVLCALELQQHMVAWNAANRAGQPLLFRVGVEIGEAIADDGDLHGDAVNIAVRLQTLCPHGGVCISHTVHEHVHNRIAWPFEPLGVFQLKNVHRPVQAFVVTEEVLSRAQEQERSVGRLWTTTNGAMSEQTGSLDYALWPRLMPQTIGGPPWIAVLPFRAIGSNSIPDYFAEGLADEIVSRLSSQRELVVISGNSTRALQHRKLDVREIGRQLGVRYVVSGSVKRAGTLLRIHTELANAESGTVLWSRAHNAQMRASFDAEDDIATEITSSLVPHISESELWRLHTKRPDFMGAYDLVLQARSMIFQLDRKQFDHAGTLVEQAIKLDPSYSAAYSLAADWHSLRLGQGWSTDPTLEAQMLLKAAEAAIARDGTNARALALLGHSQAIWFRKYDVARVLFDRALDAAPNEASGWMWSGPTYAYSGDAKEAIRRGERALRLSPRDPFIFRAYHFLSVAHFANASFEDAVQWGKLSLDERPEYTANLRSTAASLVGLGRVEEARELGQRVIELEPAFRIRPLLERHPFRDRELRIQYMQKLAEAGLPQ